ncbi:MAG: patatin [Alphaproteobacteria bacterium]|nr:MAG: patatin [Alphaproteobacteria bacterium]
MSGDTHQKKPFRVLSLDGGGMRGLYTASLLQNISTQFARQRNLNELDIGKAFDLIVGTSTGGILATGLAFGLSIDKIIHLYREVGPTIFIHPQPNKMLPLILWVKRCILKPANSSAPLRNALVDMFQNATVRELYENRHIGLCLTAVKMIDEKIRVFKTPHIPQKNMDDKYTLVDICLATSAAPIFLPLAGIQSPRDNQVLESYADGGLVANNPVLIGVIEALQLAEPTQPIHILSIGTGSAPEGDLLKEGDLNRGLWHWNAGVKTLTLSMNAQSSSADFAAQFLTKWLSRNGQTIKIVRFPEEKKSKAHLKYLQMDLASSEALCAFSSLGARDAIAAYRLSQDMESDEGKIIYEAFHSMPELINRSRGHDRL